MGFILNHVYCTGMNSPSGAEFTHLVSAEISFVTGPVPGDPAPDFDLPLTNGGRFRLQNFKRIRPVLVEFVSLSCPLTLSSRRQMQHLYTDFGPRVEFVSIYGCGLREETENPLNEEESLRHASEWKHFESMAWLIAVDSPLANVHRAWGDVPNAVYVVDRSGHIAFRSVFAGQEELLRSKLRELLEWQENGHDRVNLGEQREITVPALAASRLRDSGVQPRAA